MVLDLLLIGLAITLFPLPVMAFVLVVSSPGGVRKGAAFIAAWLVCLVGVITAVALLTGGQPPPPRSPPSVAALVATLVFGVGLVVYGARRRRVGGAAVDAVRAAAAAEGKGTSAWSAAALGVLLQPWGMVGAAAATVVRADLSHAVSFLVLGLFCLLATSSLLVMELGMVGAPERTGRILLGLRGWLLRHKEPAVIGLCVVLGIWLIGRSVAQLAG
ncbi:GAP family protein [Streptomyces termitum]|uniref:GAP family protein n=1 Tax=Streptomyces termitum TaxID=67368 RepID=UPI0033A9E8B6